MFEIINGETGFAETWRFRLKPLIKEYKFLEGILKKTIMEV